MAVRLVVMGISASGKSTVGRLLAARLGLPFVDGDDLHPPANVDKIRRGEPLTDADRAPWLDAVAAVLAGGEAVVACSALRRAYRDRLRRAGADVRFAYLAISPAAARERAAARRHWAPPALVETQLATLEPPGTDERDVIAVDGERPPDGIVATVLAALPRA